MLSKRLIFSKKSDSFPLVFFPLVILAFIFPCTVMGAQRQEVLVRETLSGDRVRLAGGKILRYSGLESPPLQSLIPLERQYGAEALDFNNHLVGGKKIWVEWDSQIRDNQARLLGYVFLEDGTFVNREILKAGYARAHVVAPNLKYADEFNHDELEARRNKRGLWRKEPYNPYLKDEYLGEKNTKVYYLPNSPELDRIPQANLVSFSSRVDAAAAGYRPCRTCGRRQIASNDALEA